MRFAILLVAFVTTAVFAEDKDKDQAARAPAAVTNAKAQATNVVVGGGANAGGTPLGRNYPGGRDEDDLKVQETLVPPTVKTDRHQVEAKVLKINVKNVNSDEPEATEQ